ncbi:MAG: hypothetical protein AAF108_08595, partial [Planctomycetota bacterium]
MASLVLLRVAAADLGTLFVAIVLDHCVDLLGAEKLKAVAGRHHNVVIAQTQRVFGAINLGDLIPGQNRRQAVTI